MFTFPSYSHISQLSKQPTTTLFHCRHLPTDQQVVIKYPHFDCQQTLIESEILPQLNHDAIIPLLDTISTENGPALVFPFADGSDLYDAMISSQGISESDAKLVIFRLLGALEYLHSKGICHCDVKPENLLIMSNKMERTVLSDFGYAFYVDHPRRGTVDGTECYAAPEVWNLNGYSEKADLWSTGVTLFESVTCQNFFDPQTFCDPSECVEGLWGNPGLRGISSACQDLLMGLLCPDPVKRISAAEALQHQWFKGCEEKEEDLPLAETFDVLVGKYCPLMAGC
jgi:serine/threonine protein kinase